MNDKQPQITKPNQRPRTSDDLMRVALGFTLACFLAALLFLTTGATIIRKISDFPQTTQVQPTDKILLALADTNKYIEFQDLLAQLNLSLDVDIITNINITTNQSITTNLYYFSTNVYVTDEFVSNYFITNVLVDATTSNYFTTNFYLTTVQSNIFLTNIVNNNEFVSNYFNTNLYTTNFFQYDTNLYVSNYFYTNILNSTSNFFTTNITYVTNFAYTTNVTVNAVTNIDYINVTNITVQSNITAKTVNVTENIYVNSNGGFNTITVTSTAAFLSLTSAPFLKTDANGVLQPTYDGGPLTNIGQWTIIDTNLGVTVNTNASNQMWFSISATTGTNYDKLIVTNGVQYGTNLWAGPTNVIDAQKARLRYHTYTPCEITGITNKTTTTVGSVLLTLKNISDSNITVTLNGGFAGGTRSHTITNGSWAKFSLEYDPQDETNYVFRHF